MKPVEAAWQPAKSLIVATNGALGELPLSLLPTAPAQVNPAAKPLFANYRNVAWLARSHAVTVVPSAAAIITLRRLPRGSPARNIDGLRQPALALTAPDVAGVKRRRAVDHGEDSRA